MGTLQRLVPCPCCGKGCPCRATRDRSLLRSCAKSSGRHRPGAQLCPPVGGDLGLRSHPVPCLSFPPGLSQELLTPAAAASTEDTASQRAAKPAPDDGRAMPRRHVARGETSLSIPAARRAIPTSCPSHHTDPNPPCPQLFAAPQLSEVINNRD